MEYLKIAQLISKKANCLLVIAALSFSSNITLAADDVATDMEDTGVNAIIEGRYDEAEKLFRSQLANPEQKNNALIYLTKIALAQGDGQAAIDNIEQALAVEPTTVDEVVLSGDAYCNQAQQSSMFAALKLAKKCIAQYEAAISLDASHANALASAVKFHLSAPGLAGGSSEKGEKFLERLSTIAPEYANTIKVHMLEQEGDSEAALRLADELMDVKFKSAKNQYEIARFYRDKQHYDKARSLFETMPAHSVTVDTKWYIDDSQLQLGEILLLENTDISRSIAVLEKYKQKNRNPFDVHYFWSTWSLAKAYQAAGERKKYEDLVTKIKSEDYKRDKLFAKEFEEATKSRN